MIELLEKCTGQYVEPATRARCLEELFVPSPERTDAARARARVGAHLLEAGLRHLQTLATPPRK